MEASYELEDLRSFWPQRASQSLALLLPAEGESETEAVVDRCFAAATEEELR